MRLRNTEQGYGLVSRVLHWVVAALVIGLLWLGWYMVDLSYFDPWVNTSLSLHRSIGLIALVLGAIKILWTLYSPPPPLASGMRGVERLAARSAHLVLFAMMIVIPVSGYLISISDGRGFPMFGLFRVPALVPVDRELRDLAIAVHYWASYGTAGLILVHALGALKHQIIDRDGTLMRMIRG
jgi:cytochrome b561